MLQGAAAGCCPSSCVSGEIGEDTAVEAMRNGASDYLLKNNLARLAPALRARDRGRPRRAARASAPTASWRRRSQRLSELAQHLQTSVEMERAAIAREIHDDVGGSLTALKFDLAWIARHTRSRPRCSSACRRRSRRSTHAIEASQRIMHNLRPAILEQGLVRGAAVDGQRASSGAPASRARSAPATTPMQLPVGRAAGGLPHGAGGAHQRQQARAGDARRRSTCRWPAACCRWRSATTAAA